VASIATLLRTHHDPGGQKGWEPVRRYRLDVRVDEQSWLRDLAEDVRTGLTGRPRMLPPKYFYDSVGAQLFDRITRLPEYYLTRTEERLLARVAPALVEDLDLRELVELGSGASSKTRFFLDAMNGTRPAVRYVPVDMDAGGLEAAARGLTRDYAFLEVHAIVGDFQRDLRALPPPVGRRLILFLGSTIGNLGPPARRELLGQVRAGLAPGDRFLVGVDLVKDVALLEAAYNDAAGVTREFNRNILRVVNRGLDGDFDPEAFRHLAIYNGPETRIEMHLVATAPQRVRLRRLDLTIDIARDESIWTESSYKFTRDSVAADLEAAGLRLGRWHTDAGEQFALALAAPV
jgi:L-histidine N-alpha-methyltransferase